VNELHLFAGAGGGILGGILLGHTTVCAVEIEPYCREVLLQRQRDGILPKFPIWDDVRTFDGKPWRGLVDVVCGGFPCQDISAVNATGEGIDGDRSGLWSEMARIVGEVQPSYVLVENSPMLTVRGIGRVLGDLAAMGFNAKWGVLGAHHAGGCHKRDRIWIAAYTPCRGLEGRFEQATQQNREIERRPVSALAQNPSWPDVSNPRAFGSRDDVANRMDRLKAIGNGQVPAVAALAWRILTECESQRG
jgi:DNA (cytosine-5)-methyltransferase 1